MKLKLLVVLIILGSKVICAEEDKVIFDAPPDHHVEAHLDHKEQIARIYSILDKMLVYLELYTMEEKDEYQIYIISSCRTQLIEGMQLNEKVERNTERTKDENR